jgi:hypothetical protein
MAEPIDNAYFNWLRAKVLAHDTPPYLYLDLLKILYRTEFVWFLIGDKNRIDDGLELRIHFLNAAGVNQDAYWFESPCSVLEVLIAFAERASFDTDMPVKDWFWIFMTNLNLDGYSGVLTPSDEDTINQILETLILRTYDHSGYGGLFPLREPRENQRNLEIWIQFNRYLDDQGL